MLAISPFSISVENETVWLWCACATRGERYARLNDAVAERMTVSDDFFVIILLNLTMLSRNRAALIYFAALGTEILRPPTGQLPP